MEYGYMNFFPLEPQESNKEHNENIPNTKIEIQSQNTWNKLWNILKDENTWDSEIKDIEPLPLEND